MKKLSIILLSFLLVFAACKKDDEEEEGLVPAEQINVVVLEQTGTWCGACPSAANILHQLDAKYGNRIIGLAIHGANGDPMEIDAFGSFRQDRNSSSFPSFFITEDRINTSMAACEAAIDAKKAETVKAAIAIKSTIEGGVITVETLTKYYGALTGDYYLSVYVTEDGIDGGSNSGSYAQTSGGSDYKHEHVLRATSVNGNFWGEKISTNPSADSEVSKTISISVDSGWNTSKIHVSAVLWKYDPSGSNTYVFVNAVHE